MQAGPLIRLDQKAWKGTEKLILAIFARKTVFKGDWDESTKLTLHL